MSLGRCFEALLALSWATAPVRATKALRHPRTRTCETRPVLPLAVLLVAALAIPAPGRSQEPSAPAAESNEAPKADQAPKPDAEQSAPAPAEVNPPTEPAPAAVGVPEVVVSAPRPKPARAAPAAPASAPRRVIAAVSPPTSARPAAAPAATQGTAASDGGPGALPKPPGQTITTVSGERIKDSPAFTVKDLLQESPGVNFKQGNGPRDIGISVRGSNARNGFARNARISSINTAPKPKPF